MPVPATTADRRQQVRSAARKAAELAEQLAVIRRDLTGQDYAVVFDGIRNAHLEAVEQADRLQALVQFLEGAPRG